MRTPGWLNMVCIAILLALQPFLLDAEAGGVKLDGKSFGSCRPSTGHPSQWLWELEKRITADPLYQALLAEYVGVATCVGAETDKFADQQFGALEFIWSNGVTFTVRTLPPESSIIEIKHPAGFTDKAWIIAHVKKYTDDHDFGIDWTSRHIESRENGFAVLYPSKEIGENGYVTLEYQPHENLVAVRISRAL